MPNIFQEIGSAFNDAVKEAQSSTQSGADNASEMLKQTTQDSAEGDQEATKDGKEKAAAMKEDNEENNTGEDEETFGKANTMQDAILNPDTNDPDSIQSAMTGLADDE
mmetsp:Transcript_9962/g.30399  ORF Transcript_9962/g.30399 Transcript_9962/m.30399 type:complete len:108 (+) Transcript_9962:57-380(+)|eukprot:CAMPEP_0198735126 /NCGR_PEP_ID=MMETSP1475-20131203/57474_1 /TAXON_ID= ORGANISM="Unidentified sp., Strain CCMP1999" /NCGR_SAMPLE_ID=MMETSP1475 /ASSEMBLY_ACC=CAM_ASM_001111 /LENGTH=107 /DNA_ID=CAMNT_0044498735 /DNA_START=64 /DNA_END=387 /DNA_ORIENTATION=+